MTFLGTNAPPRFKASDIGGGTHGGKLSAEARARRVIKNARNRNRVHPEHPFNGHPMIAPGANKVVNSRLYRKGNRRSRGIN